jgi:hypothetical protein
MSFFNKFPKIEYDFNRTGIKQNMVDLFRSVRPLPTFIDNYSAYKFYDIKNGERPDIISGRLYGTSQYYWTFFVINDFLHDGYRSWPMSQEDLYDYIEKQYSGYVIETSPSIARDSDGLITDHRNSLAGRFKLGETLTGGTSGASGKLTKKITDLSQLIVQSTTGAFIGDQTGSTNTTEQITGSTSEDSVATYRVFKYIDAPHYFYKNGDVNKKPVTNDIHIEGGIPNHQLLYVTNREQEIMKNDSRSQIRYVDPAYINEFVTKFEEIINE